MAKPAELHAISSRFDPLWLRVADPLRQRIVQGDLSPGEPLSENRLASEYGVSRTPVREALRLLMEEGLVEMLPGRKLRVVVPDPDNVREVYDIRWVLESESIRRLMADPVAVQRTVPQLERCCDQGDAALAAGDRQGLAAANEQFHGHLIQVLNNRRLLAQFRAVHNLIMLYRNQSLQSERWAEAGTAEHRELVKLVRAGERDAALALLRAHIDRAQQVLHERFKVSSAA